MMWSQAIVYTEEDAKIAASFAENLEKSMRQISRQVQRTVARMFFPKLTPIKKRRGVRGRAKAIKWRRK